MRLFGHAHRGGRGFRFPNCRIRSAPGDTSPRLRVRSVPLRCGFLSVVPIVDEFPVGTPVTRRPPGQIRTCALAHTAPLPGMTVGAETHPAVSARTSCATGHPAQCPAHVESSQIPRESGPWLLRLRRGSRPFVRRFHSYYGRIRLLHGVHQRRTASTFPLRPPRQELSRGHRGALPGPGLGRACVREFADTAEPGSDSPITPQPVV